MTQHIQQLEQALLTGTSIEIAEPIQHLQRSLIKLGVVPTQVQAFTADAANRCDDVLALIQ